jgi:hypothetical protein
MAQREEGTLQTTQGQGDEAWSETGMRTRSLVFLAVVLLTLSQTAQPQTLDGTPAPQTTFVLTIQDDLISLSATEASLKAIIEEIGRRMSIPVRVEIPAAAKVTLGFERLSLPEVLKRLGRYVNYGYVEHWAQGALRISAITVHSLKGAPPAAGPGVDASQVVEEKRPRARLEMNIDPSKYLREKRQPDEAD